MKRAFLVVSFLLCTFSFAQVKVDQVKGKVIYNKKVLKKGQVLSSKGRISTGKKSLCRLSLNNGNSKVVVGPGSIYQIEEVESNKDPSVANLLKGQIRYYTQGKNKDLLPKIKTRQAAMGIRGTDFLLIANPLLGETEIVMFEGEVRMTNLAQKRNRLDVKGGQWGGLGGRFGDRFQDPIDLPENVLKVFKAKIKKRLK